MANEIRITHGQENNLPRYALPVFLFGSVTLLICLLSLFYFLFFKSSPRDSSEALRNETQQLLDEVIALKMGLTKNSAMLEDRLVKLEENQKRQETNGIALSSYIGELNKRVQSVEIFSTPSSSAQGKTGNVDWEILVKKQLAPMPSTESGEWSEALLETITESLKGIDRILSTKGGAMDIVTGDDLGKFFKELPPPLVLIYGDTLWPGQGQLTRGYIQNVWRTETIREIQRRAVLRALGKKTN